MYECSYEIDTKFCKWTSHNDLNEYVYNGVYNHVTRAKEKKYKKSNGFWAPNIISKIPAAILRCPTFSKYRLASNGNDDPIISPRYTFLFLSCCGIL